MSNAPVVAYLVIASGDEEHRLALGFAQVSAVVYEIPAEEPPEPVVTLLSQHPASSVRRAIVDRFALPPEVVAVLEADPCHEVVRSLVLGHSENRALVQTSTVLRVLDASVDAAGSIAGALDDYSLADRQAIEAALVGHADPEVRLEAARHLSQKRAIKSVLLKDADPQVRAKAAQ